jgi:hypothetical protein
MWHTERQRIRTVTKFVSPSVGHSESVFCSSVTKVVELLLHQTSHSPLTITTETLRLSITDEKHTVASWQHILTLSCPHTFPPCCVVRSFERSWRHFVEKMVRNPKKIHFAPKRWGLSKRINKSKWTCLFFFILDLSQNRIKNGVKLSSRNSNLFQFLPVFHLEEMGPKTKIETRLLHTELKNPHTEVTNTPPKYNLRIHWKEVVFLLPYQTKGRVFVVAQPNRGSGG